MTTVTAAQVKVDAEVRSALDRHDPVTVMRFGRPSFVILNTADYELVSPVLERRRRGRPVPFHQLLTDDDIAVMADDRLDDDGVPLAAAASWLN